jgi:BlaI family transcriptional regulator, penicillinase repressor
MRATPENSAPRKAPRHAILDLAPLELHCMTAIWSLGSGTVRDIQDRMMPTRPRAYTTVMTIMDRLAQKGIVNRQKVGRAYRYQANLSCDEARMSAVQKVVAGFFDGSTEALASHLAASHLVSAARRDAPDGNLASPMAAAKVDEARRAATDPQPATVDVPEVRSGKSASDRLDESLL